ncbi:DUF7114 family protein [Halomarina ordinaria]|uniref:Polyprenyl synthetase n=1 Tax=Halomarina ordinaria TaxID=3033939 RepID=A0ABD5UAZ1_9EURY|nr:hypothetical protein [Halomarina sp. PSRA2]
MEEADAVRRAARASVDDIDPTALRDALWAVIDGGSTLPGALALLTASACDADVGEGLVERAAGVQLIYDGLRLTRRLAVEEPWATGERATGDMEILAADVLVARGFYLLARTEAAVAAVEVVRAFGRDRTRGDPPETLEADVLDLAVVVGATAGGIDPTPELRAVAADVAADYGVDLPRTETLDADTLRTRLVGCVDGALADL